MAISTPYPTIKNATPWLARALCADDPSPDDWFAAPRTEAGQRAARICAMCPVRADCTSAVDPAADAWGRRGDRLGKMERPLPKCGTRSGYDGHRQRGETPCAACRTANSRYMRERRTERAAS